jgi:hypothetical protein
VRVVYEPAEFEGDDEWPAAGWSEPRYAAVLRLDEPRCELAVAVDVDEATRDDAWQHMGMALRMAIDHELGRLPCGVP